MHHILSRAAQLATGAVLALLLTTTPLRGQNISAGGAAGTLGAGVQAGISFSPRLATRVGLFGGEVSRDFSASGVDYDGDLDLAHLSAWLDIHPAATGFRFSVGAVFSDTELSGRAPLNQLLELVDPDEIPPGIDLPEDLGHLEARYSPDSIAPYAGIGFSRRPLESGWSFTFDLGAYYQGEPDVETELRTTLPIDSIPGARELIDELLAEHEADLEEEASDYRFFPVVMLGVSYRF